MNALRILAGLTAVFLLAFLATGKAAAALLATFVAMLTWGLLLWVWRAVVGRLNTSVERMLGE